MPMWEFCDDYAKGYAHGFEAGRSDGKLEGIGQEAARVRRALLDMKYGTHDWSPTFDESDAAQSIADALGMALR